MWCESHFAYAHGMFEMWCKRCIVAKQLAFARDRAAAIPDLEQQLLVLDNPIES